MNPPELPKPTRLTPYDDQYGTCSRTFAELRIFAAELDPKQISQTLGLVPSSSQQRGQVITNSLGRDRTARLGVWRLSSDGHVESRDLRRHLDWLLAKLTPVADKLKELRRRGDLEMQIDCLWWSRAGDGGPVLWPAHLRVLADLDLELAFDLAFIDEPEAE
jgi:hypothetical protein